MKRTKLALSDGTHVIPAVIASQLFETAKSLCVHDVITLDRYVANNYCFHSGEFGMSEGGWAGVVLLVTEFTRERSFLQDEPAIKHYADIAVTSYNKPPPGNAVLKQATEATEATGAAEADGPTRMSHALSAQSDFEPVQVVCCTGDKCSGIEGHVFEKCMLHTHAIPEVEDVINECWFVEPKYIDAPSDMPARLKRNIIYWWFATNVFCAWGKHNRICLPECLKAAIRSKYPNKAGSAYSTECDFYAAQCVA